MKYRDLRDFLAALKARGQLLEVKEPVSTDLEMTWLSKADLKGANLSDANLQEAKLGESNLEGANLSGSRQHYANFQDASMEGCRGCPTTWEK